MKIGVLALQGAFREHLETLRAIGVEGVRVREPADLDGRQRADPARRREHDDAPAHRALGPPRADPRPGRARRPDLRDVRRDDRAGARDRRRRGAGPAAARRDRRAQRVRPPARLVRGRAATSRSSATRRSTRVFIRAPIIERIGPGRGRPRAARRRPDRGRPRSATSSPRRSTPSSPARRASTGSSRRWPPSTTTRARAPAGATIRPGVRSQARRDGPAR